MHYLDKHPAKVGMAMGTVISAPLPADVHSAKSNYCYCGSHHSRPDTFLPCNYYSFTHIMNCSRVFFFKCLMNISPHDPPIVSTIPNRAIDPTQTATLRLIVCIWNRSRRFIPANEKLRNHPRPYSQSIINPPAKATKTPEK